MSTLARTPENFPRMKHRAAGRLAKAAAPKPRVVIRVVPDFAAVARAFGDAFVGFGNALTQAGRSFASVGHALRRDDHALAR